MLRARVFGVYTDPKYSVTYPNGADSTGRIAIDFGVWGIPETFFVDPDGRIVYKHVGEIRGPIVAAKATEARQRIMTTKEGKGDYTSIR